MVVLVNVQKYYKREKCARVQGVVLIRWNSRHDETRSANMNQFDIDISIRHILYPGVVDVDL